VRTPTAAQLLDLWDAGARAAPCDRAQMLLQFAWPDATVAQWPMGFMNARLLELRSALFGAAWDCVADCPACMQVAEVRLDTAAMVAAAPNGGATPQPAWHAVDTNNGTTQFRLPVLGDLTTWTSGARLLHAIVAAPDRQAVDVAPATRVEIERQLLRLDPLAAIDIVMDCPACGHRWREAAEVTGMLWAELSVLARHLLGDVARLAAVFGWSEPQILALSPVRRQHYLDMVREW
jgi:hypothetical protein